LILAFIFISIFKHTLATESTYEDCPTNFGTLESAMYETGYNRLNLNSVFFPLNTRTSRFIRATYTFLNENGEDDGCNVTYIWAIGILLFYQPPSLFTYNTLYFNYPNNKLTSLSLQLPFECRPLIKNISGEECSCASSHRSLDALTQQV